MMVGRGFFPDMGPEVNRAHQSPPALDNTVGACDSGNASPASERDLGIQPLETTGESAVDQVVGVEEGSDPLKSATMTPQELLTQINLARSNKEGAESATDANVPNMIVSAWLAGLIVSSGALPVLEVPADVRATIWKQRMNINPQVPGEIGVLRKYSNNGENLDPETRSLIAEALSYMRLPMLEELQYSYGLDWASSIPRQEDRPPRLDTLLSSAHSDFADVIALLAIDAFNAVDWQSKHSDDVRSVYGLAATLGINLPPGCLPDEASELIVQRLGEIPEDYPFKVELGTVSPVIIELYGLKGARVEGPKTVEQYASLSTQGVDKEVERVIFNRVSELAQALCGPKKLEEFLQKFSGWRTLL